jgi:hypothetical protein
LRSGVLLPFLFGQEVEVTRDTCVTNWGLDMYVRMGTVGRVVRAEPGSANTWIKIPDVDRHIPIPNMNLLSVGQEESINSRFIK